MLNALEIRYSNNVHHLAIPPALPCLLQQPHHVMSSVHQDVLVLKVRELAND